MGGLIMKGAISSVSVSILLISSIFIGMVNFAPVVKAETGGPHDDGVFPDMSAGDLIWTTNADWWIEPGDDISFTDVTIIVNGNLFVNGSLTLSHVILEMDNASWDGQYNITVLSNGNLTIKDNDDNPATTGDASVVESLSGFRFGFQVYGGSLEMKNSELYDCGYSTAPFLDYMGLFINSEWVNITGNYITDSYMGVLVFNSNNVTLAGNTVTAVEDTGFYVRASEDVTVDGNDISSISTTFAYGVLALDDTSCYFANNTISSITGSTEGYGIFLQESFFMNVSYNNIINNPTNGIGIISIGGGGHDIYDNTLTNNEFGIYLYGDTDSLDEVVQYVDVMDNDITSNTNGIMVDGRKGTSAAHHLYIYNNFIDDQTNFGIRLLGNGELGGTTFTVNNIYIYDNIISNNRGQGVRVDADWFFDDVTIVYCWDNTIIDNRDPANNDAYGYYLNSASDIYILRDSIERNDKNIYTRATKNVYVINATTIKSTLPGDEDIRLTSAGGRPSSMWLFNTTIDPSLNIVVSDADSFLNASYYLHVKVMQWGMGVDNADVWINNSKGNPEPNSSQPYSTGVGNDGWIRWLDVTGFNRTLAGYDDFSPHQIQAYNGSASGSALPDLRYASQIVTVQLNTPPDAVDLDATAGSVLRTNTVFITANGTDFEDPESDLIPHFEYQAPAGFWETTYLGIPQYDASGFWKVSFTPSGNAVLGFYDFRVSFEDTEGFFSDWLQMSGLVEVLNNPPVASAGPDDAVSAGTPYLFDASGSTDDDPVGWTYAWDIDDGDGLDWITPDYTGSGPLHTYLVPGIYTVTLNVTDAEGAWDTDTLQITVTDNDPPVANAGPDGFVKINTPYNFSAAASTDNVGIVWYNWSFGDGAYDNGTNVTPQHIYTSINMFTVTLKCTDAAGNWATSIVNITVILSDPPVANAGSDNSTDEDSAITLDGSASTDDLGITGYFWDIDDSDGIDWASPDLTGMVVGYTYLTPGVYIVTLNVTDGDGGWDTDTLIITVNDITNPVANAGPPANIDEDTLFMFDGTGSTDNSGSISSYNWNFGDGYYSNGTDPQPTHTYTQPGNYTVILNVSDTAGNWDTESVIITVLDITPPVADAGAGQMVDENTAVFFDASVSFDNVGIITYYWDMDDSDGLDWVSPDQMGVTPVHVYSSPGTYTVTLNCTDAAGNSGYANVTIIVNDITDPTANAGPDDSVNEDAAYNFDGSGSSDNVGVTSYKWDIDSMDGVDWLSPDKTGVGPSHIYIQPGSYVATLRVEDAAGNWATDTVVITVNDITDPVANAGADDTVNHGTPKTFDGTGSSDNVAVDTYEWDINAADGLNWVTPDYTGSTPTHNYAQPGIFTATLRVTDATGNWATDTVVITVVDIIHPLANAGLDDSVNEDASYQFDGTGSSDDVAIVDYAWDIDDGDGIDWITPDYAVVDPSHIYTIPGQYTATLRVEDGDGNWDTDTVQINVLDITDPTANSGFDDTVDEDSPYQFDGSLSNDNSGAIASYNWDFNDGTYDNGTDPQPFHTFAEPGVYIVTLTTIDSEGNSNSDTVQITVLDVTSPLADAGPDDSWDEDMEYFFDGTGTTDNSGTIVSYDWDFGDGNVLTGTNPQPTHTYVEPGIYIVTLNVTDTEGNWATDTMVITIEDITDPSANAGPDDSVNEDSPYIFNASGSTDNVGIENYAWDVDSGDGIDWSNPDYTGISPSHTFSEPGVYAVTLNVSDDAGNWYLDTVVITVIDITPPTADAGPDDSLDEDVPYTFDASGSSDNFGVAVYMWDVDDSDGLDWVDPDLINVSATHSFTEPGIYTVTLRVNDATGNWAQDTVVIEVYDITSPSIVVEYADSMNEDVAYEFNASATLDNSGIASFNFTFGDGFYKFGASPTAIHTYEEPGTYTVTVTVTDLSGNSASEIFEVIITDTTAPSTPAGFTVSEVEAGEALNLSWLEVADDDLHHYELFVSEDGTNFESLGNLTAGTLSFTHEDLTNGDTYYYYIVAVDNAGLSSAPSDTALSSPDKNFDGDAEFDLVDEDDDNDGVDDVDDLFPNNPDEWADFDEDGIGDNTDDDDDGDGILDVNDDLPLNSGETIDSDGDGLGDNEDPDDDNDGIFDEDDAFPYDPEKSLESEDFFTYLLYLIIIIALIIAAVLGAKGGKHKRHGRELERKIQSMENAQAQAMTQPPPTAAPAPPPWMQAKKESAVPPPVAEPVPPPTPKASPAPPAKPPVKEEPKPAELISAEQVEQPTEDTKPSETEAEPMAFEAADEQKPIPAPPPTKSAEAAKPEGEAGKPRPPRAPKKKKA
jgi:parallel beta-helix repeat protein